MPRQRDLGRQRACSHGADAGKGGRWFEIFLLACLCFLDCLDVAPCAVWKSGCSAMAAMDSWAGAGSRGMQQPPLRRAGCFSTWPWAVLFWASRPKASGFFGKPAPVPCGRCRSPLLAFLRCLDPVGLEPFGDVGGKA
jgi:hypothetical protein